MECVNLGVYTNVLHDLLAMKLSFAPEINSRPLEVVVMKLPLCTPPPNPTTAIDTLNDSPEYTCLVVDILEQSTVSFSHRHTAIGSDDMTEKGFEERNEG